MRDGGREKVDRARGLRRANKSRPARDVDLLVERVEQLAAELVFTRGEIEGLKERLYELEERVTPSAAEIVASALTPEERMAIESADAK